MPKKNSKLEENAKAKLESEQVKAVSNSKKSTTKSTKASSSSKKSSAKKTTKKSTSTSKSKTATKRTTKKVATKKSSLRSTKDKVAKVKKVVEEDKEIEENKPKIQVVEYYDLPYRYNQTVVKVLYQTPNILFIYWDISDADRRSYMDKYGDQFFNNTKPVLIVHNDTMHYSFEIEIDDFANSWYLHVNDANCKYAVELGRRPKYVNNHKEIDIPNDYLYVTYSNEIESPNDHVLIEKLSNTVYFKDVKTNIVTAQDITSLSFMRNMGKLYSLYDIHTDFNESGWLNSNHWQLDMQNPSSGNPTSSFK